MNIFNLITGNAIQSPQSLRFPERHTPTPFYRGRVVMDPAKCLACGICDYVCVSAAIEVTPGEGQCEWTYDPARCTYCGRCVDHCPGAALTQADDRGPSYGRPGELAEKVIVIYPSCPECGKPAIPFNDAVLGVAFKDVTAQLRERVHLCDRCRRKATVTALKKGFGATADTERNTDER